MYDAVDNENLFIENIWWLTRKNGKKNSAFIFEQALHHTLARTI